MAKQNPLKEDLRDFIPFGNTIESIANAAADEAYNKLGFSPFPLPFRPKAPKPKPNPPPKPKPKPNPPKPPRKKQKPRGEVDNRYKFNY
jgi:hypothetical protein